MKNESNNSFNPNKLGKASGEKIAQSQTKQSSGLLLVLLSVIILTAAIIIPIIVSKKSNFIKRFIYSIWNKNSNATQKIKKFIDLHCHLDGAITLDIAKKLAALQNITLPTNNDIELEALLSVPDNCESLNDFLNCFGLPLSLMQTPEGLTESVRLVADNIQSQGVIYAEFRFAPQLHLKKGMTQEDAIIAALEGIKKTSLKVNLILQKLKGMAFLSQFMLVKQMVQKVLNMQLNLELKG